MNERNFRSILAELDARAQSTAEKGHLFERLVKAFLEQDKAQSQRFAKVWLWSDWPDNGGRHDTGIDIVAEERDTGNLVAIQCKFYSQDNSINLDQLNKFLTAYGASRFDSGIMVATTDNWTRNAEGAIRETRTKPVTRWGPDVFENSSIDWSVFDINNPSGVARKPTKNLRSYQQEALDAVTRGLKAHDRGKLIMACGSGKTFTALRIAEQVAGPNGTVLFLTPSISLLSQSLLDWSNDADLPLKTFAVCSDAKAGQRATDDEDISPYDLRDNASTNPDHLVSRYLNAPASQSMTVVFSTYQSLDVISAAQQKGFPDFDLIVCDEAHRTTGASREKQQEASNFQRVHDNNFVKARKRLYMTATPRMYGDRAKRKANEKAMVIASMDDDTVYGPVLHHLGFSKAVEMDILSPYRIVILHVDQEQAGIDLNDLLLLKSSQDLNLDTAARMIGCHNGLQKQGVTPEEFAGDPLPAKRAVAFSNTIKQSQAFTNTFPEIIAAITEDADIPPAVVKHVDGTQNALQRSNALAWLREETDPGTCRILSNARCLTEGIDVPALDAILFLHPRKSEIDVVQAVGRVMRQSPGKQCGYIILPVVQPPGLTAQEALSSSEYHKVWQVADAIISHDDRFTAYINQLALSRLNTGKSGDPANAVHHHGDQAPADSDNAAEQGRLPLIIAGSQEVKDAILAKMVDRYTDPDYWKNWGQSVRGIALSHEARLRSLLNVSESQARPVFDRFLTGIRSNLNDGITEDDAIGMLSQHLITKPVFDALFANHDFTGSNAVSRAMQETLDQLQQCGLQQETQGLEDFYRSVRISVKGITDPRSRQQVIADLYQQFFRLALPETAQRLGIVYTPTR